MTLLHHSTGLESDAGYASGGGPQAAAQRFQRKHKAIQFYEEQRLWRFFLDSYTGGHIYVYGLHPISSAINRGHAYLFRHTRELQQDYRERIRRAYFLNYCRTIIEIYIGTIYTEREILRKLPPALKPLLEDADGKGTDWHQWYRENPAVQGQVTGQAVVVVDMPRRTEPFLSRAQELASGEEPYCRMIWPGDLVDYSHDRSGNLRWIVYMERPDDEREPGQEHKPEQEDKQYRVWFRDKWELWNFDGSKLIDEGAHNVGRVPVVFVKNLVNPYFESLGISAIDDIAFTNREVFNVCSLAQEIIYKQCFPFLAWPIDETADASKLKIGTGNFVPYPPDGQPGQYISPPVEPLMAMFRHLDRLKQEMYRQGQVSGADDSEQRSQVESGAARAYKFNAQGQNLVRKAVNMERGEREIFDIAHRWKTGEGLPEDAEILYPREFAIEAINLQIEQATSSISLGMGPTFENEVKQRLVNSILPTLPDAIAERIRKEIEEETEDLRIRMQDMQDAQMGAAADAAEPPPPPQPSNGAPTVPAGTKVSALDNAGKMRPKQPGKTDKRMDKAAAGKTADPTNLKL